MENYYRILGLNSSATKDEIRRAYRVLARRYHPDVNPGKDSGDKFKKIAEAYRVLNDTEQKRKFDLEFEMAQNKLNQARMKTYAKNAQQEFKAKSRAFAREQEAKQRAKPASRSSKKPQRQNSTESNFGEQLRHLFQKKIRLPWQKQGAKKQVVQDISIIEVSLSVQEAISGLRKTVEVADGEKVRKLSVRVPPGVRTGSVIRMRNREAQEQELVLIIQVANHPFLSVEKKGIVVALPVTTEEALYGANIKVPTLEDPVVLKVPAGSQNGTYIRLREKGAKIREGTRGDLFFRLNVQLPENVEAPGIKEAAKYLSEEARERVRSDFPNKLI